MVSSSHSYASYSGGGDGGGPWYLDKTEYKVSPGRANNDLLVGPIIPVRPGSFTSASFLSKSDAQLDQLGTTAIARTIPTNPIFDAATFVGEAREGAPRYIGHSFTRDKVNLARSAGDEYLNVEFGWKPLISDLRDFAYAIKHANRVIDSYRKGSDRKIKRSLYYPSSQDVRQYSGGINEVTSNTTLSGIGTWTESVQTDTWFEGAFRYHIPVSTSQLGKLGEYEAYANKLFGLRLTPETVWNVSPWSWAADWFGTTGDVLHNISALGRDGLVLQYGYMMSRNVKISQGTIAARATAQPRFSYSPGSIYIERGIKQRRPATPYGFGIDLKSLSTKQISILAALGLSKGGKPWQLS